MIDICWKNAALLNDPVIEKKYLQQLSVSRREKCLAIGNPAERRRSIAAGIALENLLRKHGVDEPFEYAYSHRGKPYLKDRSDIQYSISHSGQYAVAAVSDQLVGIDIESIDRPGLQKTTEAVLHSRFISDSMRQFVMELSPTEKTEWFLIIWTLAEALAKAMDLPVTEVLQNLEMHFSDPKRVGDEKNVLHFADREWNISQQISHGCMMSCAQERRSNCDYAMACEQ